MSLPVSACLGVRILATETSRTWLFLPDTTHRIAVLSGEGDEAADLVETLAGGLLDALEAKAHQLEVALALAVQILCELHQGKADISSLTLLRGFQQLPDQV